MKVTGTREAFIEMIEVKAVYKILGVSHSTVANWKRSLIGIDDKNRPSLDKMEEMLLKYGATIAQEKVWKMP